MPRRTAIVAAFRLLAAALLAAHHVAAASAQDVDPESARLPSFYADVCGLGRELRGSAGWFAPGSATEFHGTSEQALLRVLEWKQRDDGWLLLTGHIDPAEAGVAIGLDLQRAETVRRWFIDRGLPPDRVWTRGRGTEEPIVLDSGPQVDNRRVEFLMTDSGLACWQRLRAKIHAWFVRNCFPTVRAAEAADCDEALRLLR